MDRRTSAAFRVASKWRVWKRLPRLAAVARSLGFVSAKVDADRASICGGV